MKDQVDGVKKVSGKDQGLSQYQGYCVGEKQSQC